MLQAISKASKVYKIDLGTLLAISWCESSHKQGVTHPTNKNGSTDAGLMGINSIHLPELKKLGLDRRKLEDNAMFAAWLASKQGFKPWNADKDCRVEALKIINKK